MLELNTHEFYKFLNFISCLLIAIEPIIFDNKIIIIKNGG